MKASEINKFPKGFKRPDISQEERVIIYKLCSIRVDDTPQHDVPGWDGKPKEIIPVSENIPASDRIMCDGKAVNIAVVRRVDSDGEAVLAQIDMGRHNNGRIIIDPKTKDPRRVELYEFMELTHQNGSNPDRNANVAPKFIRVDETKMAISELELEKLIAELKTEVFALSDEQVTAISKIVGIPHAGTRGPEVDRSLLVKEAGNDPKKLKAVLDSSDSDALTALKQASEIGIITHDKKTGTFTMDKEVIFSYTPGPMSGGPYKKFAKEIEYEQLLLVQQKLRAHAELEASKDPSGEED